MMVLFLLTLRRLMAIQAVNAFACVRAYLIFVYHRILSFRVAFCALPGGSHKFRCGLSSLYSWPSAIDKEGSNNQGESKNDGYKNRTELHVAPLSYMVKCARFDA